MRNLICIVCPKGCHLTVDPDAQTVTGNSCERGIEYGLTEVNHPTRTLTTTVRIDGAMHCRLPVKTSKPIPKEKMMNAMSCVEQLSVHAPVKLGDIILKDLLGTGADLVACRNMETEGSSL